MSRPAILFKAPPYDSTTDTYVQQLESAGYTPHFVQVLDSILCDEEALETIVRSGPGLDNNLEPVFIGVIITSTRAADAWIQAVRKIAQPGDWSQTPFFVVGENTGRTLEQMVTLHPDKFAETCILGGSQAGNSEALARFILADLHSRRTVAAGRLLYLTGDKNKDTLHRIMSENRMNVESLMVYKTEAVRDLGEKIELVAQEIRKVRVRDNLTWLIFFAPSSSDFALPYLRRYFQLSQADASPDSSHVRAKLGAIGPTTATFLRTELHLRVDTVAAKPTAAGLVASICESDRGEVAGGGRMLS